MPRDAYISLYSLGAVDGYCHGQNILSSIGLGRPFDGKIVFYSSLFQAGIDRVVVLEEDVKYIQADRLPERRLHVSQCSDASLLRSAIRSYFDHFLGPDWAAKVEALPIIGLECFLGDLLTSLRLGRPLLRATSYPDLPSLEVLLPLEILSPIQTLFESFRSFESVVAIPALSVSRDRLGVIDEIMASRRFKDVEEIHLALTSEPSSAPKYLIQLEKASKALYWGWKDFLRMKTSVIRLAQHVPAIIESLYGKGPSTITKPIIETLDHALHRDTSLLIYDAHPILQESAMALVYQMLKAPQPTSDELNSRVEEMKRKFQLEA